MKDNTLPIIVIYMTDEEKADIRECAKQAGKPMSRYLLDLHLSSKRPDDATLNREMLAQCEAEDQDICENEK